MRLTLRVLLAYLDNILEPADAKIVEAKIAESENVSTLVHHIREITKRMRIGAPEVLGKGLGLDPNTVAEYLDYGLSDDGVRDFENICMTSDVHMAEVAACHEILSLVLVKPAEIDPAARQRMYGLLHEPQSAPLTAEPVGQAASAVTAAAAAAAAQRAAAAPTTAPAEPRRKAEVPDYLRQPEEVPAKAGPNYVTAAVLLLLVTAAALGAVLYLTPYESLPGFLQPVAATIFPNNKPAAENVAIVANTEENKTPVLSPLPPAASVSATTLAPSATAASTAAAAPAAAPTVVATAVTPPAVSTTDASTAGLRQPASAMVAAAATTTASSTGSAAPPLPNPPAAPATGTTGVGTSGVGTTVAAPSMAAAGTTTGVAATGAAVTPTPAVSGQPAKVEAVGRVSSDLTQILLRFDPKLGWVRLQQRDSVSVGDRLLALPAYRPQLMLANGLTVNLVGGTAIELLPLDPAGTPGLRFLRGRLLLFTVGGPSAKIVVEDGAKRAALTLSGAEVALEHFFRRYPGSDPIAQAANWSLVVTAKSGGVVWSEAAGDGLSLASPGQWVITDTATISPLPGGEVPLWVTTDDRDLIERQAADYIETALRSGNKAVSVALEEIVGDRRIENQQLALKCLAQLGDFDDIPPILNDPTQRYAVWDKHLEQLVAALDWGPFYAERIRGACVKQFGPEKGAAFYQLLWGYDDQQLQAGAAKLLVETLDAEDLAFRVGAYWMLTRITGLNISYAPQDPPLKRRQNIPKWVQKLEAGQIVHKKI